MSPPVYSPPPPASPRGGGGGGGGAPNRKPPYQTGCQTKYTNPTDITTCIPSTEHELTPLFAIQVLDGEIQKKGMVLPFAPEMYRPMLKRLRDEGIQDTEKSIYL